jgi:hypothetical protein
MRGRPLDVSRARAGRTIAILLWLYPRPFRREYGAAIAQLICDQRRELGDANVFRCLRFWTAVLVDTLRAAHAEHLAELRGGLRRSRARASTAQRYVGALLLLAAAANVLVDVLAVKLSMGIPAVVCTIAAASSGAGLIVHSRRPPARQG